MTDTIPLTPRTGKTRRAFVLVQRSPHGVGAKAVAQLVGISTPTACAILARLFWAGLIDRWKEDGEKFRYAPREPRR